MVKNDLHSTPSSDIFKPRKLIQTLSPYALILVFTYLISSTGKLSNSNFLSFQS